MRQIIYIGDAMCSWCWGFSPVIEALREKYGGGSVDFILNVGGLRPGKQATLVDEKTKRFLRHHWHEVAKASNQPFKYDFFDWQDFLYDTEPAARAVVCARKQSADLDFPFFKTVQEAFYVGNRDVTKFETLAEIAASFDIDQDLFREDFESEEMQKATYAEFYQAANLGATGFPTVLVREENRLMYLTKGYLPFETLDSRVATFLEKGLPKA